MSGNQALIPVRDYVRHRAMTTLTKLGMGIIRYVGIDRGDTFADVFGYGASPRQLRSLLMHEEMGTQIRWYARRAARSNDYIKRFLRRAKQTTFFKDRTEMPAFKGVPTEIAQPVAEAWANWWRTGKDSRGRPLWKAERAHFRDWLVDGEIFFDFPDDKLRAIPSDMIVNHHRKSNDYAVESWLTDGGNTVDYGDLIHCAIIESNWQLRGMSYLAQALPEIFWHMEFRDNTGQGIRDLSKLIAVTTDQGTGNASGLAGLGAGGFDAVTGQATGGEESSARRVRRASSPGFVAALKSGEKLEVASYGPPENAMLRADTSPRDIAIALGVSESEITGDHFKHNFASLQVAGAKDLDTYTDIRQDWYAAFRLPVFDWWLPMAIGQGIVPAAAFNYIDLLVPRWKGPRLISAQPEKDARALRQEAEMGQVNLKHLAASQGENATTNAEDNAAILSLAKEIGNGKAKETDSAELTEKIDAILDKMK